MRSGQREYPNRQRRRELRRGFLDNSGATNSGAQCKLPLRRDRPCYGARHNGGLRRSTPTDSDKGSVGRRVNQFPQTAAAYQGCNAHNTAHTRLAGTTDKIRCYRLQYETQKPSATLDSTSLRCVTIDG